MIVRESLSASGALYGFGGWLTSRDKPIIMSSRHDAAIVAELIDEFITKQKLENPKDHWEDELISMYESSDNDYENVKEKIKNSKKLSKDHKTKIESLIIQNGIHGTTYNNGRVFKLNIPKIKGKSFNGVSLGADENGFFVFTHRARSKSFLTIEKITKKDIEFIKSTG